MKVQVDIVPSVAEKHDEQNIVEMSIIGDCLRVSESRRIRDTAVGTIAR
jgi:hypothetical protein